MYGKIQKVISDIIKDFITWRSNLEKHCEIWIVNEKVNVSISDTTVTSPLLRVRFLKGSPKWHNFAQSHNDITSIVMCQQAPLGNKGIFDLAWLEISLVT